MPGNWSFQPVAIEVSMEVTKQLKHFGVEGRHRRFDEHAGLDKANAEVDPTM